MAVMKNFPVINMKATGANILKLRKSSGYSVTDFQTYFNFDAPQAIYKWQRGDSIPSTDNLLALSYLLDVPIEKILVYQTSGNEISPQEKTCGDHFFCTFINAYHHFFSLQIRIISVFKLISYVYIIWTLSYV